MIIFTIDLHSYFFIIEWGVGFMFSTLGGLNFFSHNVTVSIPSEYVTDYHAKLHCANAN